MRFNDIPGLDFIKEKLIASVVNGKVAHAQLFVGNDGALNLPLALAFITFLHCENKQADDACGKCAACSKSLKYIHPDTHFIFPMGNMKTDDEDDSLKVDTLKLWRSFLIEHPFGNISEWVTYYGGEKKQINISADVSRTIVRSLSLKAFESSCKVMLIWQPEYMHASAANGILKILEEPAPNTFFFLVSNADERLLPTILSRTQIVPVPLLDDAVLAGYLDKLPGSSVEETTKVVRQAEGNLHHALTLLGAEQHSHQDVFTQWMRNCFKKDYGNLVSLSEDFHELDKLSQRDLLDYGLGMLRECLLYISGAMAISRANGGEVKFVTDFSKFLSVAKIEHAAKLIDEAGYHLERHGSAKMIFMDLSIQLSKTINP